MESILTATFALSEEEKDEFNEVIRKLMAIKSDPSLAKCEDAKQKLDDAKAILVAIRDGRPMKIK